MIAVEAVDLGVCRACNAPIRLVFLWEGYPYDTTCDCAVKSDDDDR